MRVDGSHELLLGLFKLLEVHVADAHIVADLPVGSVRPDLGLTISLDGQFVSAQQKTDNIDRIILAGTKKFFDSQ